MADEREETSRLYGPPRITIVPHEGTEEGPPQLHASRLPSQPQALRIIKPLEAWYPPARSTETAPASTVFDSQRVQRRWLFNAHPEAFIGSSEAADFLAEGLSQIMQPEAEAPSAQPLMAISQMADVSNHTRVHPAPVLAMATGESGEVLRLSKLNETKWQWGEHENPSLRLLNVDQQDREETVLWSSDGAPIQQIKPALSLVRFEPTRWLLVQKRTSTTILQPEYHRIPVSERPPGIDRAIERPSRINPKPILTITSEQTGGFAHSDISFKYGSQRKPPQLAIIDECGYYSVWDIKGRDMIGSTSKRAKLRHCGHIQLGVTDQLPDEDSPAFRSEHHGVLWTGSAGLGVDLWDVPPIEELDTENDLAALTALSKKLLLWNRNVFEVIDLKDPSFRKTLPILKANEPDYILDVKLNPVNRSQVVILTTSALFWIETSSEAAAASKTEGISLLQSFAHLRGSDADGLKLTVHHRGHDPGKETCIVYLYSEKSPEVDVFWLTVPEKTGLPQFQHYMMRVENESTDRPLKMHTLCPTSAFFIPQSSDPLAGLGSEYINRDVGFQQLFILGKDLGMKQTLMSFSSARGLEVVPPDNSRDWSKNAQRRAHRKRRKQFLHYIGDTFVVPDGLGDMDELVQRRANRYQEILQQTQGPEEERIQQRWPRTRNFDLFASRIAVSIDSVIEAAETPDIDRPLSVFEAIHQSTMNCLETEGGYIPLHTLHEYEVPFEAPPMDGEAVAAWDSRLQELFATYDQRIVAQPFATHLLRGADTTTPLADIWHRLEQLWGTADLNARARRSRSVILAETAEAIARSLFGVAVLDERLLAEDEPPTWVPTPPDLPTQQSSQRLSMSSQRSSLGSQRLSMSPLKPRNSMSPIKASRGTMSPIKPRFSMSPIKPRFSMSPLKPRGSMSPAKHSSQPFSSSNPFSSNPFSSSAPQSSAAASRDTAAAAAAEAASTTLSRLSMLAADINTTDAPARQHSVLSYWPAKRGVPTENYVSSVLASSTKHIDAIKERRERVESRRRKRKSQLYGGSSQAPVSSQGGGTTQDEMEDSGPATQPEPATQPLPKLAPPVIGSSQFSPTRSSQPVMSSQIPQVMSQPLAGRHGMRSPKKKGKRKSGF